MTSELRPGLDFVLEHTPRCDVPAPEPRVTRLRKMHTRMEGHVTITSSFMDDGRFVWLITATNPATGDYVEVWTFDRRGMQKYIDQFAAAAHSPPRVEYCSITGARLAREGGARTLGVSGSLVGLRRASGNGTAQPLRFK